jgi:hypothetical protein
MSAIANAAYTRDEGPAGRGLAGLIGLANFRPTGQWIGHANLHENSAVAQVLPGVRGTAGLQACPHPAKLLAALTIFSALVRHPHGTAPTLGTATS